MSTRTRVLYIAGSGRSGTTLLGHILGQIKGFCFVGEAIHAWRAVGDRLCGCGVHLESCDFWNTVRREAGDGVSDASDFFGLGRVARWRHLPLSVLPGRERRLASRYGRYWEGGERFYRTTAAVSGADLIVDSSKSVPYGRMLGLLPGLDVRVVQVVRDARAVANSWMRVKVTPDRRSKPHMEQHHPARSAINWNITNGGADLVFGQRRPYLRLRYEDLAARPLQAIERVVRLAMEPAEGGGEPKAPVELPFVDERTVKLAPTHSIKGNPDRLHTGPVEIKLDDRWTREMAPRHRRLVTALTWPLLARYGYLAR